MSEFIRPFWTCNFPGSSKCKHFMADSLEGYLKHFYENKHFVSQNVKTTCKIVKKTLYGKNKILKSNNFGFKGVLSKNMIKLIQFRHQSEQSSILQLNRKVEERLNVFLKNDVSSKSGVVHRWSKWAKNQQEESSNSALECDQNDMKNTPTEITLEISSKNDLDKNLAKSLNKNQKLSTQILSEKKEISENNFNKSASIEEFFALQSSKSKKKERNDRANLNGMNICQSQADIIIEKEK